MLTKQNRPIKYVLCHLQTFSLLAIVFTTNNVAHPSNNVIISGTHRFIMTLKRTAYIEFGKRDLQENTIASFLRKEMMYYISHSLRVNIKQEGRRRNTIF